MMTTKPIACGVFAMVAVCTGLAAEARAACFTPPLTALAVQTPQAAGRGAERFSFDDDDWSDARDSIVGMWLAEFLIGEGPARYDQSFQQFHSDGTEIMISNGVPPALGNVCAGVWKREDRAIKLRHTTWNWDANGNLTGTFVMVVVLRVDRHGNSFRGTWSADSFDLSNNVIPEAHAEGIVRAVSINVD